MGSERRRALGRGGLGKRALGKRALGLGLLVLLLAAGGGWAQEPTGETVRGTVLRDVDGQRRPVPGVRITVTAADGTPIETVTTARDGSWAVQLPGPGRYATALDTASLPEGVTLRDEERATLEFTIRPGQQRTVLYPLGTGSVAASRVLQRLPQLLVEGIKFGLIIAITAIGLSLVFGTTGLVNFAHGELVTFGALAAYFFNASPLGPGLALLPAAVLAVAAGALLGAGLDGMLFRPLRARGTGLVALLVITIGLSLLVRNMFLFVFGGRTRPYAQYAVQRGLQLGPVSIAPKDLVVVVLSLVVLVLVGLLLERTRIGKAMRAVADNRELAESSGIDVQRVILFVWMLGSGLAALGGIFQGLGEQVSFQMGFQLLLLMFAGVILGGLGTAYGALLGSLVVGVVVQTSTLVISTEIKYVSALLILIVILMMRPQGILGRAERVG